MLCAADCSPSGKKRPPVPPTGHDIGNIHESCLALLARRNPDQIWGITLVASMAVVFVFCVYSSLQFGVFTWYISRLGLCRGKSVANALMISLAWVVASFSSGSFSIRNRSIQGHYPTVIQVVDILGVSFLGFLMFFANVSVFYMWTICGRRKNHACSACNLNCRDCGSACYGSFREIK